MEKFKGMSFEQCVNHVSKMSQNEKLEFFTIRIEKMNPFSEKYLPHIEKSLPDLRVVHPWWRKIEMLNYGKEFYEYYK